MSSVGRLLIFHASIGNEHVQTGAHFFFPPALVWLHLTFCKIRTRFKSCSAEQRLGERRNVSRRAAVQSALSLRARPYNVTFQVLCHRREGEPFWFASPVGRLKQPQCCFKSLIFNEHVCVWSMFPVSLTVFVYGIFFDTYLHHYYPLSCLQVLPLTLPAALRPHHSLSCAVRTGKMITTCRKQKD